MIVDEKLPRFVVPDLTDFKVMSSFFPPTVHGLDLHALARYQVSNCALHSIHCMMKFYGTKKHMEIIIK